MSERGQPPDPAADAGSVEQQAGRWFARLRGDQCSAEDRARHQAWLQADPAHRRAYAEMEALWKMAGGFADQAEIQPLRQQALADTATPPAATEPASFTRRWLLPGAAAAVLLLLVLAFDFGRQTSPPALVAGGVHQTLTGEQKTLALIDGSTLVLDTQTRLRVDFSGAQRRIELQWGQARFDVAHQQARPFVVRAGSGDITALGTAFIVRKVDGDDSGEVRVTLLQGRLAVAPSGREPALAEAGQQLAYSAGGFSQTTAVTLEQATAWQQGRLIFEDHSLAEVLDDLNRYSHSKILLGDDSLGEIRITGVFKTGDSARIVETLRAYFSLRVSGDKQGNLVLLPAG